VPVSVSDGHTTTSTTLSVSIEDDSPKAQPVEVSVDTTDSMTNVMLIIDVSGSMNSSSGVSGFDTRLDAAKQAMDDLLDQYELTATSGCRSSSSRATPPRSAATG